MGYSEMRVEDLKARRILLSSGARGFEVEVSVNGHRGIYAAPIGVSKSRREPVMSLEEILETINEEVRERIVGIEADVSKVDSELLGFPVIVRAAVSIAHLKALASALEKEPYEVLEGRSAPALAFNVVEGGRHARNGMSVQEFLIIPKAGDPFEALDVATSVYHELKERLSKRYTVCLGLEAGLDPIEARDSIEALEEIHALSSKYEFDIAIDAAASHFYKGRYEFDGRVLDTRGLLRIYEKISEEYGLSFIEDPFDEDDKEGYEAIRGTIEVFGDDVIVSHPERIEFVDGVVIKPDHIGTITEVVRFARSVNKRKMVSHRSQESEDSFIVDLAFGISADLLKAGAPARERIAKYNRVLRLFERIK